MMRRQASFAGELGIGLLLSVLAAGAATTALLFVPAVTAFKAVIAGVAFAYLCVMLGRSPRRVGRTSTLVVWLLTVASAWLGLTSLAAYAAVHIVAFWLVRALHFRATVIEALLDLGVLLGAIGFAVWAAARTDSWLLASWCFFVAQASHVLVPELARRITGVDRQERRHDDPNRRFADAVEAADAALRRLVEHR